MAGIHSEHSWGPNTFTSGNHSNAAHARLQSELFELLKQVVLRNKVFEMDERAFLLFFFFLLHSLAVDVIQCFVYVNAAKKVACVRLSVWKPDAVHWSSLPVLLWWSKFWVMVLFQGGADELLMLHWKTYSNSECTLGDARCLTLLTKYQQTLHTNTHIYHSE